MVRYAIIDDTDPALVYTGDWRLLQTPVNPATPEYNGTVHATNDPTATVTYTFNGSFIINTAHLSTADSETQRHGPRRFWYN